MEVMIRSALDLGVDFVKVQVFDADQMTLKRYSPRFKISEGLWHGEYLWDLYDRVRTPRSWLSRIIDLVGLERLLVSIFHPDDSDLPVKYFKVASPEIGYEALLYSLEEKEVFLSTGLASEDEIQNAVDIIPESTLLHCVSKYPASLSDCNISTLLDMRKFGRPLGLSDHSLGFLAAVLSVGYGCQFIEKHMKVTDDCPDAAFSLWPLEFKAMMEAVRSAEEALGVPTYANDGPFKRKWVDGNYVRVVE